MTFGRIADFALERYFARWEFAVEHQLSASDVEPLTLGELLALADGDATARWDGLSLGYTESAGLPALRQEISRLYEQIRPEHVLVVAGAEEGIFLAMHALLASDDDAIVVAPFYQSLYEVARSLGARVTLVPLRAERGWELDPDEAARAVTRHTRVIAVNFPHNPTGAHIGSDVQQRLVDIAESTGAVLFSDEVYRGLEYRPDERLPAAAFRHRTCWLCFDHADSSESLETDSGRGHDRGRDDARRPALVAPDRRGPARRGHAHDCHRGASHR